MFFALAATAVVLSQSLPTPRTQAEDIYCAAAAVVLSEGVQRNPAPHPEAEASMYALMLYFLGRVEASRPTADAPDVILDMAQGMNAQTLSPTEIMACATFMQSQAERLTIRAQERGRAFR
ncbi:MAG: hypothetical protein EOP19_18190 [Hyphomicrobiales bacterium]|nr:MAG: hypothetical protein EOP19_18190 [Hyphomicrobiales bacterium]